MSAATEQFDSRLEAFLDRFGFSHGSRILEQLTNDSNTVNTTTKQELMLKFLRLESLETFNITHEQFEKNTTRLAREARCAMIHLYRSFTMLSFPKIGSMLSLSERKIRYAYDKCEGILEVRKFEKQFSDRYSELEEKLVAFIATI